MARILPAKPSSDLPKDLASVLRELEKRLPDTVLIIQGRPFRPSGEIQELVILAPGANPVVVGDKVDPKLDTDLKNMLAPDGNLEDDQEIHHYKRSKIEDLVDWITDEWVEGIFLLEEHAVTKEKIDQFILSFSPGATPYGEGGVTVAQKMWRNESLLDAGKIEKGALDSSDDYVATCARACEKVFAGRIIHYRGSEIPVSMMSSTSGFLPAVLLAAAEQMAPIVRQKNGIGGFSVYLKTDSGSTLGCLVSKIEAAAHLLFTLSVYHSLKKLLDNLPIEKEVAIDDMIERFDRWLADRMSSSGPENEKLSFGTVE